MRLRMIFVVLLTTGATYSQLGWDNGPSIQSILVPAPFFTTISLFLGTLSVNTDTNDDDHAESQAIPIGLMGV